VFVGFVTLLLLSSCCNNGLLVCALFINRFAAGLLQECTFDVSFCCHSSIAWQMPAWMHAVTHFLTSLVAGMGRPSVTVVLLADDTRRLGCRELPGSLHKMHS
jgi:hypothetical protein